MGVRIDTYLEKRKGKPFGPVAQHLCGLAEDGTWFKHYDGQVFWGGGPVEMSLEPPPEAVQHWGSLCANLLFSALMTLSFMHCKNVSLDSISPPEKLSRQNLKRHGFPLVHYKC